MTMRTGIETLIADGFTALRGKRVGLLTNASAVDARMRYTFDVLREAVKVSALFSPEHGFAVSAADGEHVPSQHDPRTGIMIHSLYGSSYHPTPDMFDGLDVIVVDLQDIGVRYYTYAWTMTYMLEAAGAAGLPVLVLNRPNPLGEMIDGPVLDPAFASLVGRCPIPVQHGLTLGEFARLFNRNWNPTPGDVMVIGEKAYGWDDTPFVPTSPAMPHLSTVLHYPGACLVEGTNLSEGRGTALPFEISGAPYIDIDKLLDHLRAQNMPGVLWRPHTFKPTASKHASQVCFGVQAHRLNAEFRPLTVWIGLISAVRHLFPDSFAWNVDSFDRLAGSASLRTQIDAGMPLDEIAASWTEGLLTFAELRREALL
jgi:uncharacterized protein YbbC (DUF1343 family)